MALAAGSVFEIQSGGTDTNGGGFVTGASGTDYSLVTTNRVATGTDDSTTDVVANNTATLTSATANFQSSIVGNIIYLQGGTGGLAATWRQVVSRTNATTIVVDANVVAGTGITMNVGGCLKTVGGLGAVNLTAGNKCWFKSATYTTTVNTNNVANGKLSKSVAIIIEGYQTTRGDYGTKPIFTASGISAFTIVTLTGTWSTIANISIDCASLGGSRALTISGTAYLCEFKNCQNSGVVNNNQGYAVNCYAENCDNAGPAFNSMHCYGCVATGCSVTPFQSVLNAISYVNCISYGNAGATVDGFLLNVQGQFAVGCVAYNNGRSGFRLENQQSSLNNCIAEDNTGNGFHVTSNIAYSLVNCAGFSNAADFSLGTSAIAVNINPITGTSTFFTNAAAGDFSLNNTAGGGADLREAGSLGVFPGGLTTGYLDIGAAQHQGGGGGGGGETSAVF